MLPSARLSALSPRTIRAGALGTWLLCCVACGRALNSKTADVLKALGTAADFKGGDCTEGQQVVGIYLEEIGRRSSVPLGETVPKFAKRAAAICPKSRSTITPGNQVEVSKVGAILGLPNPPQDGTIPLENWLELTIAQGKVVSLTIVLDKVPR
jgi:hypothetical protein